MRFRTNLIGQRFGRLVVVERSTERRGNLVLWSCRCDCGTLINVRGYCLTSGDTKSCNCSKRADIAGKHFGRLTVIKDSGRRDKSGSAYWVCQCECGGISEVRTHSLTGGHTRSCGCLLSESGRRQITSLLAQGKRGKPHIKHGHAPGGKRPSRTYCAWKGAKNRCFNMNEPGWIDYGGRGITMCERWRNSFRNFLADMGEVRPGLSLDRINNDGNYEPGNCRWATQAEQHANRRPRRDRRPRGDRKHKRIDWQWLPEEEQEELGMQ